MPIKLQPRGFALLIVLWSLALLALLGTGLTAAGRSDAQLAANIRRAAAAQAAADGGVEAAVFHVSDAPGRAWLADGQPRLAMIGAYAVTVTVRNESRRVNPNYAPPGLVERLLAACGAGPDQAQAIARAIAEWHEQGVRGPALALYGKAGLAAAPTGNPFRSVDEVGLVIGMTPALLACLRPHLSVYARGPPDFAQADPVVRAAVLVFGGGPPAATVLQSAAVLDVTADARGRDGSRFVRHAIVALGQQRTGPPFGVLLWDTAGQP